MNAAGVTQIPLQHRNNHSTTAGSVISCDGSQLRPSPQIAERSQLYQGYALPWSMQWYKRLAPIQNSLKSHPSSTVPMEWKAHED